MEGHRHKKSLTNVKRQRVGPKHLPSRIKWLIGAIIAALIISAGYTLFSAISSNSSDPEAELNSYVSIDELKEPEVFMSAYLAANCSSETLEEMQSIRIVGTFEEGESSQEFMLIKKRPHYMRLSLSSKVNQMTIGFDGKTVWQKMSSSESGDQIFLLNSSDAEPWLDQACFFDRIVSAHLGDGRILSIEFSEFNDTACLKVYVEGGNGARVSVLVDPKTMYMLSEEKTLADGRISRSTMSDYRVIDGLPLSFEGENYIGGVLKSRFVIKSVEINIGILSAFFEIPKA